VTDSWSERLIVGVAVAAIVAGIALRCTNIPDKLFWHDEAHGALRVSGFTAWDLHLQAFRGIVLSRDDILQFQHPVEHLDLSRTLVGLANEPQHPPLYYLATRLGFAFSDDPRIAMRVVAVAAGLLLLPALYWLWMELFGTRRGALMLVALVALSPLQVLYSQEARQYSLWVTLAVAATAALLRARRGAGWRSWVLYSLLVALGLYTHLLFAATLVAHAAWVLWECYRSNRKALVRFGLAVLAACTTFLPWCAVLLARRIHARDSTAWLRVPHQSRDLVDTWGRQLARQFVDLPGFEPSVALVATSVVASLAITARYVAASQRRVILLSIAASAGIVVVPDLIFGGVASTHTRYLLPALVWIAVCINYSFVWLVSSPNRVTQFAGLGAWLALLVMGFWSGLGIVQSDFWWNKTLVGNDFRLAEFLNAAEQPLLVVQGYEVNPGQMLSVSHSVGEHTRFLPIRVDQPLPIDKLAGDVFVLNPTPALKAEMQAFGSIEALDEQGRLWSINRRRGPGEAAGP